MKKRYDNNRILAYSCLHFPFQDRHTFDFLADLKREYEFDRVIDLGDTLDQYCFSRYPKDPKGLSINEEIKKARKAVAILSSIFPKVEVMQSNHCERLYSKATLSGIPREFMRPYRELIGAPDGWRWHKDLTLTIDKTREHTYFCHERGNSPINLAKSIGMNVVHGHIHNSMGIQYFANPLKTMFAATTGCLISDKGCPFSYNKANLYRPMKGALIIIDGVPELKRLI